MFKPGWKTAATDMESILEGDIWRHASLFRFVRLVDELLERIYFVYHVACGQPARGAEESGTLIVNTATAPRNIYLRGNEICVMTWYHKGRNHTGKSKPQMTFLPGKVTKIFHYYLGFLRPVTM